MANPMMKCGHAANATDGKTGEPCCVICWGNPEAEIVDKQASSLEGRIAKCTYRCGSQKPSSTELAFFKHWPDKDYDEYYCGCLGWN